MARVKMRHRSERTPAVEACYFQFEDGKDMFVEGLQVMEVVLTSELEGHRALGVHRVDVGRTSQKQFGNACSTTQADTFVVSTGVLKLDQSQSAKEGWSSL